MKTLKEIADSVDEFSFTSKKPSETPKGFTPEQWKEALRRAKRRDIMKKISRVFNPMDENGNEDEIQKNCPACGNQNSPMGTLGKLTWYRCRNCGMEYHGKD